MVCVEIQFGAFKGKKLYYPERHDLRPTLARSRDVLFNWIPFFGKLTCLDLFAGTGILGLQALCLGAERVHFVEKDSRTADDISKHLKEMRFDMRGIVFKKDFRQYLMGHILDKSIKFDVIFLDPPFDKLELLSEIWPFLPEICLEGSRIYIELPVGYDFILPESIQNSFIYLKRKKISEVNIYLLQYQSH